MTLVLSRGPSIRPLAKPAETTPLAMPRFSPGIHWRMALKTITGTEPWAKP